MRPTPTSWAAQVLYLDPLGPQTNMISLCFKFPYFEQIFQLVALFNCLVVYVLIFWVGQAE